MVPAGFFDVFVLSAGFHFDISLQGFMEKFDREEGRKKKEEEELMEADDEGWVTVTKSSKKTVRYCSLFYLEMPSSRNMLSVAGLIQLRLRPVKA